MQFLIFARDATDADAPARRQLAREEHLAMVADYKARGHMIVGAALLDENTGQMNGSAIMAEFDSREALDEWLTQDPYVVGNVWAEIDVIPCRLAPAFQGLIPKKAA